MEKEFIPYEQALALKELGFDDPCLAGYNFKDRRNGQFTFPSARNPNTTSEPRVYINDKKIIGAPLYQQAFRWFREKYGLYSCINIFTKELGNEKVYFTYEIRNPEQFELSETYNTYEEAELECLKKLIEIVKDGK